MSSWTSPTSAAVAARITSCLSAPVRIARTVSKAKGPRTKRSPDAICKDEISESASLAALVHLSATPLLALLFLPRPVELLRFAISLLLLLLLVLWTLVAHCNPPGTTLALMTRLSSKGRDD